MLAVPNTLDHWGSFALALGRAAWSHARHGLDWMSGHTGVPVALVAGTALVLSWRLAKKAARLMLEIAVATALIFLATRLGWIRW